MSAIATAVLVTITEDGEVEHWSLPPAVAASVIAAERARRAGAEPQAGRRWLDDLAAASLLALEDKYPGSTEAVRQAPAEADLVTVSREDLRVVLRSGSWGPDLIAAADRLAFAARYTTEETAGSRHGGAGRDMATDRAERHAAGRTGTGAGENTRKLPGGAQRDGEGLLP